MGYFKHLRVNLRVAINSLKRWDFVMFTFHFLHGLIPFEITSHHRYLKRGK